MSHRRALKIAFVASSVLLAGSELLDLLDFFRPDPFEALVQSPSTTLWLGTVNSGITFLLSLPIYFIVGVLAQRIQRPFAWVAYAVAVLLPLAANESLSSLRMFSPRGGPYFPAIWLFGPFVAVISLVIVIYVRWPRRIVDSTQPSR